MAIIFSIFFYYYNDSSLPFFAPKSVPEYQNDVFKVMDIPGKGKGVIAMRDIKVNAVSLIYSLNCLLKFLTSKENL